MARPLPSYLPLDWPAAASPLDFAGTPLGPGLVTPMEELDAHGQPHQHYNDGYEWGAWYNADHDLDPMQGHGQYIVGTHSPGWSSSGAISSFPNIGVPDESHESSSDANMAPLALAQTYSDSPYTSHHPSQHPTPYFPHPMDNSVQFATTHSPPTDLNYSPSPLDQSSTRAMSNSTTASITSSNGRKPRTQRERNRLAAHKCRQKSKLNAEELQQKERELAEQHRCLTEHVQFLRNEVLDLKNEILRHGTCDCELIGEYIARAAQSLP